MQSTKTLKAISSEVAKLLRVERLRQKLSMSIVAERAGLSQQMVSYVEREMRNPTLETMLRIASALELNLGELIIRAERAALKSNK